MVAVSLKKKKKNFFFFFFFYFFFFFFFFFFFKQKTAYEIVVRDWSSDVCSSDLCKHEYRAYEDSSPSLLLSMTVPPRRIGIFLDCEAGTVSFYNVTNHGLPIYTFSKYYFPSALCPYFNPCSCIVPMTLRRPTS